MATINVDLDYLDHWKTELVQEMLGPGADALPVRLWLYTARFHAEKGEITGTAAKILERRLRWWGEQGKAVQALTECGFLEQIDGGYRVHDWLDHNRHVHTFRARGKKARASQLEKMAKLGYGSAQAWLSENSASDEHKSGLNGEQARLDAQKTTIKPASEARKPGPSSAVQFSAKQCGASAPANSFLIFAEKFAEVQNPRCSCVKCSIEHVGNMFESLLQAGLAPEKIEAEVLRKGRVVCEHSFRMTDRLAKMVSEKVEEPMESTPERHERIRKQMEQRRFDQAKEEGEVNPVTFAERIAEAKKIKEQNESKDSD
jgi:hypothetical protein